MGFFILPLHRNQKHKVMKKVLVLKQIAARTAIVLFFKDEDQLCDWWIRLPCPQEFDIIYEGNRSRSKHRYELTYSKFDGFGNLYTKYALCYSKREAVYLEEKIKEINSEYITKIKKNILIWLS